MTSSRPSQYIKGWVEFYKLKFKVTPDTLIPRPETELLVDEVIKFVSHLQPTNCKPRPLTILDLGTGAGNIAISLAKNLSHPQGVTILATDISQKALEIARQNAGFHKVEDRIKFNKSNLLENVSDFPDIIVTNLPYIPSARIPYLDSSVKDFEPLMALDGGEDGFGLYRKLFQQIKAKMDEISAGVNTIPPQGWKPKLIIGEIDYTHGELAVKEARKYFPEAQVEVETDLAHKQRILIIRD